ncbi:MAG: acyl-CoA thioesterase [Sedimenticola sp.]|jgi:acyl-CoA thioesterase YciA|nr:MAG: acyl-CoA thioesterase [Sedimenticola sp.]
MQEKISKQHKLGERQMAIRVLAMPADTNPAGDIFGGWLMSQADIAGSIVAVQVTQGRIVTVAVNEFRFLKPVFVGDLVTCFAGTEKIGRTSISVKVDIYAERARDPNSVELVAEAAITYVAVDEQRKPRVIPPVDNK